MRKYLIGALLFFMTFISGVTLVDAKESISVNFVYKSNLTELNVGDKGEITVEPIYGVTPKGTYAPVKNDDIDLKEDGSFTVLKSGKFELNPSFTLSSDSEKEIKLAYMKENNIENGKVDDYVLIIQDIQSSLPINVSQQVKTRDINFNFEVDTSSLKVGEKGKISVKPLYDVRPKGKFKAEKNEFIDLKEDGSFTALKAGKTSIKPTFTIFEESVIEIDTAYIAQLENPKEGDTSFPEPAILQEIPIEIKAADKEKVSISLDFTATPASLAVDSSGKLTLANIYGVTPKGTFKAGKNEFINLKEDGSYTALQVGKIELKPVFTLSEDSVKEIKEAYIKQENKTNLTVDDIELIYPDTQQIVTINVTEKATITSPTKKPTGTNKNLPQTSDTSAQPLIILGVSTILLGCGVLVIKRKSFNL